MDNEYEQDGEVENMPNGSKSYYIGLGRGGIDVYFTLIVRISDCKVVKEISAAED